MRSPRLLSALACLAVISLTPVPPAGSLPPSIAFASRRDGHWEIYRMDADGQSQTRLTSRDGETT